MSRNISRYVASLIVLAVSTIAVAADPQLAKEIALARTLQGLIACKSFDRGEANLYCTLDYRGLKIEFAGVNDPRGGTLYVHSMGANQTLGLWGSRCLLV